MKDKDIYTVPLEETHDKPKNRHYRSDTVPDYQINKVRKLLKVQGYRGKIVEIRNTRVDNRNSFRVVLRDDHDICGKFLVNLSSKLVRFDGTIAC